MSTNAIAIVHAEYDDKPIVAIYKHWDGYPSGFGEDLKKIADPYTIVNGLSIGQDQPVANGMECFAAFLISALKDGPGDVYIYPVDDGPQEYNYHLRCVDGKVLVTCDEGWEE